MLVKNLLADKSDELITATPKTSLDEAMKMLIDHGIACLLIIDKNDKLVGIVSDRDIFKKVYETKGEYHNLKLEDIMTSALIVGLPTDKIANIAWIMEKNYVRHIPIVEGEKLIGIVSERDIIKHQTEKIEIENRYLTTYMEDIHHRDMSGD
jgi:CBS domain-containing protein